LWWPSALLVFCDSKAPSRGGRTSTDRALRSRRYDVVGQGYV
jgi:hypothetical protein